jgi:thiol-disulfide isomerase/thioredoxin
MLIPYLKEPAMRLRTITASVCLLGLALFAGLSNGAEPDTEQLAGKAAPDFSLKTLDGKNVTLSEMKGKVVVIDFWATWCPPCRKSLPHVQKMSADKELADKGLVVWAVNAREAKDLVQKFLTENKYTFAVPMDPGKVMTQYLVQGIPTTIIVGRDGKIRKVFVGFGEGSEAQMDEAVNAAVAEKP